MTATTNNGPPSASVAEPTDANTNGDIISGSENGSIDAVDENEEPKEIIATKVSGTVKWFNVKSGYGFINRNDTKEDVFVHQTAIVKNNPKKAVRSVGDGEVVEFDVVIGEKGNEASNVSGPEGIPVKGSPYAADRRRGSGGTRGRRGARFSRGGRGGSKSTGSDRDANTSGEETTDGAVEEIEGDAHSHPRGKPSYVPRGRGRGGPRGGFRGRFIRRGGGGTRYPSKYLGKEGGDEQQEREVSAEEGIAYRAQRYGSKNTAKAEQIHPGRLLWPTANLGHQLRGLAVENTNSPLPFAGKNKQTLLVLATEQALHTLPG